MTTYIKTMKVIDSCSTLKQLMIGTNYIALAYDSVNNIEWKCIVDQFIERLEGINGRENLN